MKRLDCTPSCGLGSPYMHLVHLVAAFDDLLATFNIHVRIAMLQ